MEIIYISDVVVLHIQMGEVGGKVKVANVCDLIIIQVKDSEVSTHGEITLKKKKFKSETYRRKKSTENVSVNNGYLQYLQYSCWKSGGG